MEVDRLDRMVRGWFVGDFEPTLYRTTDVEIGVKRFEGGDVEARHVHRIATEITAIIEGSARMNGRDVGPGDIIVLAPGESTDFEALSDVLLVVVKLPGFPDDKFDV